MKKSLYFAVCILLLACLLVFPVFAAPAHIVDGDGFLTASEKTALGDLLDGISERQKIDLAAVLIDTTGSKSPMEYADDYYDDHGYRSSGALLLIADADGQVWISTSGEMAAALSDRNINSILDDMMENLYEGDYAAAIRIFAIRCDTLLTQYRESGRYDPNDSYGAREPFNLGMHIVISLGVGFAAALIVVTCMKGNLKSVNRQSGAAQYIKADSFNLRESRDTFLYHRVSRIARQQNSSGKSGGKSGGGSSMHRSSSGASHGGGGRSFR